MLHDYHLMLFVKGSFFIYL